MLIKLFLKLCPYQPLLNIAKHLGLGPQVIELKSLALEVNILDAGFDLHHLPNFGVGFGDIEEVSPFLEFAVNHADHVLHIVQPQHE